MLKYTYDADGNLLSVLEPSSDLTENTYDFENQLIETELPDTTVIVFTYDGFLKRVQRDDGTTVTKYLWDDQNVLQETDDSLVVEAVYTVAPQASRYGTLVSQERDSASSCRVDMASSQTFERLRDCDLASRLQLKTGLVRQFDAVGSTIQLTDETGVVTDEYVYTAFGDVTGNTGSTENPYQWIGREGYYLDPGTARYNLRRREYQANIARFLQQDPLGLDAGDPNLYRYVENDPVNQTDPSGLQGYAAPGFIRPSVIPPEGGGGGAVQAPGFLAPAVGESFPGPGTSLTDALNRLSEADRLAILDLLEQGYPNPTPDGCVTEICIGGPPVQTTWVNGQPVSRLPQTIGPRFEVDDDDLVVLNWVTALAPGISDARDIAELLSGRDVITGEDLTLLTWAITALVAFLPYVPAGPARRAVQALADPVLAQLRRLIDRVPLQSARQRLRDLVENLWRDEAGTIELPGGCGPRRAPRDVGPSPRTPVGRSGQQHSFPNPNAPRPRNSPTTINGRDYSGHAIDRMQERGFVPSVVENAIRTGTPTAGRNGTTVFTDTVNNMRVIVDSASGRVVTVIPGG